MLVNVTITRTDAHKLKSLQMIETKRTPFQSMDQEELEVNSVADVLLYRTRQGLKNGFFVSGWTSAVSSRTSANCKMDTVTQHLIR